MNMRTYTGEFKYIVRMMVQGKEFENLKKGLDVKQFRFKSFICHSGRYG